MVALRKDVKLGLTLGGIVVSVIGVYAGLSALAGEPASAGGGGVELIESGAQASGGSLGNDSSIKPNNSAVNPGLVPPPTPIGGEFAAGRQNGGVPAGPTEVVPGNPIATNAGTPGADLWEDAFRDGQLRGGPRVTQTPTPAVAAKPGATPTDIIKALETPAPRPTDATPTAVANANETQGSLVQPTSKSELTSSATKHVVAHGETLSTIAAQYYGNSKNFQLIAEANPGVNPNRLKIGQELVIPAASTTEPAANVAVTARQQVASSGPIDPAKQYVVKGNDSLHRIAAALYGDASQWERIYNANKALIGNDPARLKLGMVLTLPEPPTKRN